MDEAEANLIQLLWGEIPLNKEADTLRSIRDQDLYETWEESFDWDEASCEIRPGEAGILPTDEDAAVSADKGEGGSEKIGGCGQDSVPRSRPLNGSTPAPRSAEAGPMTNECTHESLSGVDQTPLDDPAKVWRCDGCDELIVHDDGMTAVKVSHDQPI